MSQQRIERKESLAIAATHNAASAFGEDIADDTYSVSELSHVEDEKLAKRVKGHPGLAASGESSSDAFLRTTISRATAGGLTSAMDEGQVAATSGSSSPQSSSQNDSCNEAGSDASPDRSLEGSGSDVIGGSANDVDDLESPSESSFAFFAKTRFYMKGTTHAYCCAALSHPLLPKEDRGDYLASLAAWVLILRIMGDLPDRDTTDQLQVAGEQPSAITVVRASYKTKYSRKDVEEAQLRYSELFKEPIGTDMRGVPFLPEPCDSMLEKVQYVVALGIYRTELRDELYCQLCKQLTNNPSRNSSVRGWVLLSLLAGSFSPSEKFAGCFKGFLKDGPLEFSEKADRLVRRTCAVGTRGYPPSWLEFQASKNNKPLLVPVTFMNGYRTLCEVDSATTVQELVNNIAEKIGLKDPIGFSIYVTLHTKISCLGHGNHRVMDAISECEQHTKSMGLRESSSLWRLYFRREYFTPWLPSERDHVNTDLVYEQITRGVALGEYKCEKEEVLILIVAQKFYIEYREDVHLLKLDHFVRNWLTDELRQKHEPAYFVERVRESLQKNFLQSKPEPQPLKMDIVLFAMDKWFLQFSRFYDALKVQGPLLELLKVVVALNSRGVYILDDSDTIRMHLAFWEVANVFKGRQATTIRTLKGDDYAITNSHAEDFFVTLTSFIHGLRMRSRYSIVTQEITQKEGGSSTTIPRGELFLLSKSYSETAEEATVQGVCRRTSVTCTIPRDKLYLIATMNKPTADMLSGVMTMLRKDPSALNSDTSDKPCTLQQYSRHNFRAVSESTVSKLLHKASFKRDRNEALWQFSREPLKKPLLRRTCARDDLVGPASRAFAAIQQYMGDQPLKQEVTDAELANAYVLDPSRRNKYLREEIFCQLMKQLTNNPDKNSEEKGWILMTLLCATAAPSGDLFDQCLGFLKGAKNRHALLCTDFLNAQKTGGSRLFSPHPLEHEMMTKQQPNIRVQVMVPSGTPVTLEVGCRTRMSDIKREMKRRLRLHSIAEYSLFLSAPNSMHCLPDRGFYFDCLSHADIYWMKSSADSGDRTSAAPSSPGLVMLKKIWVNVQPGQDPEADRHFHFPQEVPNFVRDYHQCSHQEVIRLSALLYRSRFGNDSSHFKQFREVASMLLPRGFSDTNGLEAVSKEVEEEYRKSDGISQDEARSRFLHVAVTWPTYGSVFFEVKQRVVKSLPKYCLVAINTSGVHVSDLQTKELKETYEFSKIPNWAHDDRSFTLIISAPAPSTTKLLLETSVGHNMDDVLMSHIAWVMETQMKRKHGFYNNVGESIC